MAEPPPKKARGVTAAATDADAHEVVQQLVEVKETVSAGRGLFTTRAVAAGTTLAAEVPVLRWVDVSMQDSVCGWCLCHFAAGLSDICKGCSRIRWCSVACRTAHAVEHGAACAVLAPLGSKSVRPEVDALLGVEDVSAIDRLCCDVLLTEDEEAVCKQVHALLPTAVAESTSLERIRKLHRQEKSNSFLLPLPDQTGRDASSEAGPRVVSLPNPTATGRAIAIYPRVLAMANHSCWPSAVRIDPSPRSSHAPELASAASAATATCTTASFAASLSYRALEPLAKGTEVTQSYIGIGWPQRPEEGEMSAEDQARFVSRKDYLQDEYNFQCACARCKIEEALPSSDEEDDDEAEGINETDLQAKEAADAALEALQEQDMELQLWLMKHLCEKCGGTLTPMDGYIANSAGADVQSADGSPGDVDKAVHVCNSCGARRPDKLFDMIVQAQVAAAGLDSDTSGDEEQQQGQDHDDDSGQEYEDID